MREAGRFRARLGVFRRRAKLALIAAGLTVAVLTGLRLLPKPPLQASAPYSTALQAEDGRLLRLTLANDEQYRLWTPLAEISPHLREAVLRYEDRWFYYHPGVNPIALIRSAFASIGGKRRQGGSTLTMQLARKLFGIDSRSVPGKIRQIVGALWIEARYGKREILEAYLNFAPYGGNIEGVGAASLVYFHKSAVQLSLPESISLAVIPQNPRQRGRAGRGEDALRSAHQRLADIWLGAHPNDARFMPALVPPMFSATALPFRAPHLTDQLLLARHAGVVKTTIAPSMQTTLERVLHQYVDRHRRIGLRNAAAMLVDTRTMSVKALVGSADFGNDEIAGQVNGTLAKRSPGSTLKPFVYALAMDQGVLHPLTILKDAPTSFGPFSPENFDGEFVGPISAQDALVRSRNVPAVAVSAKLQRPNLYDLLKQAGVSRLASEQYYGLALTLGGGEVTMEELVQLYAMLPRGGRWSALRYRQTDPQGSNVQLLSDEASFVTLEMLKKNPRPDTGAPAHPTVAWKTGTSWGFRDAWTAGVFDNYVLAVWVGNFDGEGNPAFVGVRAAAPLFFELVDALRSQQLVVPSSTPVLPAGLTRVEVCVASGELPNDACRQRAMTWFIPGKSPIRVSRLHRYVLVDSRTGNAVCEPSPFTRWEIHEYWDADMRRLFRQAGMPRKRAPDEARCATPLAPKNEETPQILSPRSGQTYSFRLSRPVPLALRASTQDTQFWFADNALLGATHRGEALAWTPPRAGHYLLRVADEHGNADTRDLEVEFLP